MTKKLLNILNFSTSTVLKHRLLSSYYSIKAPCRNWSSKSFLKKEDPEEIKNMPVLQFESEKSRKTKRLYLWGSALYGNLGQPNFVKPPSGKSALKYLQRPYKLGFSATHRMKDVACGNHFTVFSATSEDNDYQVFGTGLNTDSQIGLQQIKDGRPFTLLAAPVPIQLPIQDKKTKVTRVACGRAHTVILTDNEGVFTLGNNSFGQCGRTIVEGEIYEGSDVINKVGVSCFEDRISDVVCGQDHTIFLTKNGAVYSCGWGADGQTGHGNFKSQGIPKKVKGDIEGEKIIKVAGSADCVLALSDKGEVFGWGNSEYGQLNFSGKLPQHNSSIHIPLPGKVKSVAAGGTMCGIVNDKCQVYVWGYGILGQGPNVDRLLKPTLLPDPLFGKNELNPDVTVEQISCGLSSYAVLTNKGDLYVWGTNKAACLGLGHDNNQFFPFRVSVPARVQKISIGLDHMAALCHTFA